MGPAGGLGMAHTSDDDPRFHVPAWLDFLGGLVERWPSVWSSLGNLETRLLRDRMPDLVIDRPIYIAGLARSGSTVLLELLARHPDVVTHRYRDFPMIHVPWAWNRFVDSAAKPAAPPRQRAHGDGIEVTAESPEAFEEVIWASFFRRAHDPSIANVLEGEPRDPEFDRFYRDHLAKLLWLRGGSRYLAKGNYNVTRLGYLLRLFPDARFVIPIRDPVWHVASLMRQHELFLQVGSAFPRVRRHMRRAGHFEFGADLRPINTGDTDAVVRIQRLWSAGAEIEGWARYWSMIYRHVADRIDADPALAAACFVVRFEDLCRAPGEAMRWLQRHVGLESAELPALAEQRIRVPDYYRMPFTPEQRRLIRECTEETAIRFGYPGADAEISASAANSSG